MNSLECVISVEQSKMTLRKLVLATEIVAFFNEMDNARERCIWGENPQCKIMGMVLLNCVLDIQC